MSDSVLMTMLNTSMRYNTQRQKVIAQNISNLDTPGYHAQDLKKLDFKGMAAEAHRLEMRATSPKHLEGTLGGSGSYASHEDRKNFEITPVGNSVVLEEQMGKISDTGASYQISNSLYKKYTGMYRSALGNR